MVRSQVSRPTRRYCGRGNNESRRHDDTMHYFPPRDPRLCTYVCRPSAIDLGTIHTYVDFCCFISVIKYRYY